MSNPLAQKTRAKGLETWIHAAHMSRAAYEPGSWKSEMEEAGWTDCGYLESRFSFGAGWVYKDGKLRIVCAGTKGVRDVLSDALSWIPNRWSELGPSWRVGYGMVRGPRAAWPALQAIMRSTGTRPVREIIWGGHSMGGTQAQLCHGACRCVGLVSSCTAVEPARVFSPHARDEYRLLLKRDKCGCDVIINTVDGRRDWVTAHPVILEPGGDLNVLGEKRVFSGYDALEQWRAMKAAEKSGERSPLGGRYEAHGLEGVIEHMDELLELQRAA